MPGKAKSEFWWASIAGAKCEPVEVTLLDSERVAYTCGCQDPFYLDRPDCPVELVPVPELRTDGIISEGPALPPLTRKQEDAEHRKFKKQQAELASHRWRGPRNIEGLPDTTVGSA